ncbi:uncharacterized protein LOC113557576 [Rhopalosiphum maidis]|uniref:uncharacterized protein LOC113557576 n=1 Tax=Rhopalosiphum maidis TaxID=43146 RepID=UPI000F00E79E|nr:uncharacterized protein LOC113557576 [Rhopalosiphum maidis]
MDPSNLDDKPVKFSFTKDGVFTFKRYETNRASESKQGLLSLRLGNILIEFKSPELADTIRNILSSAVEKAVSKEEFEILKHHSNILKSPGHNITNNAVSITPETNLASNDNT